MNPVLLKLQGVQELPNFLTFVRRYISNESLASFIEEWENVIFSLLIAAVICLIFYWGTKKREWIPYGFQNFLEWIVEGFQIIVLAVIGPSGEKYVPFLGTLFIYVLSMNLVGLIPLMKSPSSSLNITVALAICVFVLVQYLNIKNMGVKGFLFHLVGSPKDSLGWLMAPLMFPIELLTQISRPITLALRLFGNILGEKILITFFAMAGAAWFYFFPIQTPFLFLGLLTSVMQAMVFTLLSMIYIMLSVPHDEGHDLNH